MAPKFCCLFPSTILLIAFASLLSPSQCSESSIINAAPVIGIVAGPKTKSKDYIAASYTKWLEMGGARSIAIPFGASDALVDEIFSQVNGVFFPGGSSGFSPVVTRIWELAVKANADGDFFPLWGTCLGFEHLLMAASEAGKNVLDGNYDAENMTLPLRFTDSPLDHPSDPSSYKGQLYADDTIRTIVSTQNVTFNNHVKGIEPSDFYADEGLKSKFIPTTTNIDRQGRPFVSTIEPIDPTALPVYGVQFHPEKSTFEYGTIPETDIPVEVINHSEDAILMSFSLSRFFVNLARKNVELGRHSYTLHDRHPPIYTYPKTQTHSFEQEYLIPNALYWEGGGWMDAAAQFLGFD